MSQTVGTRAQVFHGTAERTSGGLRASDLMRDDDGRIKSKAASMAALERMKKEGKKHLTKVFKPAAGKKFKLQPKEGSKAYQSKIKKMA
ncbi:hypothetical protein [Dishui Lake phycodnavirus 4]|jgi:hypothetical protein|nr:hypothetical protein [Dishui Lake phycodnavirus 4]